MITLRLIGVGWGGCGEMHTPSRISPAQRTDLSCRERTEISVTGVSFDSHWEPVRFVESPGFHLVWHSMVLRARTSWNSWDPPAGPVFLQCSEDSDDSLEGLALFPCFLRRILIVFM